MIKDGCLIGGQGILALSRLDCSQEVRGDVLEVFGERGKGLGWASAAFV